MWNQFNKEYKPLSVQPEPSPRTKTAPVRRQARDINRSISDINHIPEYSALRPLLALLAHPEANETRYAAVVEQVFTAFFYSYLWTTTWKTAITSWLGEGLAHTIRQTPHRKFKAALPWLSLACQPAAFYDCLCAELLFSLFYLYDDLLDNKTMRYGQTTALGKFGPASNRRSWDNAHRLDTPAARELLADTQRRDLWLHALDQFEVSEDRRLTCRDIIPFERYRQQSFERMGFLGDWWRRAAHMVDDTELQQLIDAIYPLSVFTGQIRNDLRNTDVREATNGGSQFSDFTDGWTTAVTILVRQRVSGKDRSWIERKVWNSQKPLAQDEIVKLYLICQELEVLNDLKTLVSQYIRQIESTIKQSCLSEDVKAIWLGWVFRQYRAEITSPTLAENPAARRFIEAAGRLSAHAQAMPLACSLSTTKAFQE